MCSGLSVQGKYGKKKIRRARGHPRDQNDGGGVLPRQPRSQSPPVADPAAGSAGETRAHAAGTPEVSHLQCR